MRDDVSRARTAVERAIARHWPRARAGQLEPVAGDASARRYLRCSLAGDPAAPATVVVMLNEGSGAALSSDELGVFGKGGPKELPFVNVQRYLARLTDAVPRIYEVTDGYGEVVLEDVGDVSLWQAATAAADAVAAPERGKDAAASSAAAEELFGRALDLLADLQARAVDDGSGCYAFRQAFDERLFAWELEHFVEYGLDAPEPAALEACRRELAAVARALAVLPRAFAHRDYHAWNLHLCDGRVRILDFQDALLAPALYDVASLLTDRITPSRLGPDAERRLVDRYAAAVAAAVRGASPAALFGIDPHEAFTLCALQRVLKVIGRFNFLAEVKGKPRYAEMLPAIVPTARRLCAARPDLAATADLLARRVKGGTACAR